MVLKAPAVASTARRADDSGPPRSLPGASTDSARGPGPLRRPSRSVHATWRAGGLHRASPDPWNRGGQQSWLIRTNGPTPIVCTSPNFLPIFSPETVARCHLDSSFWKTKLQFSYMPWSH